MEEMTPTGWYLLYCAITVPGGITVGAHMYRRYRAGRNPFLWWR